MEKLRADAKRVRARIAKMEEEQAKIKFPIKDEQLIAMFANADANSSSSSSAGGKVSSNKGSSTSNKANSELEASKPLPAAVLQVSSMLPDEYASDAVGVWDFLNVFRSVLSFLDVYSFILSLSPLYVHIDSSCLSLFNQRLLLKLLIYILNVSMLYLFILPSKTLQINAISWEDFVDLLKYTGRSSLALTDIFCSVLKIILSDSSVLTKLTATIPRKVNYAYRSSQGEFELNPTGEVDFNLLDLQQQDDFDTDYNGLKLLPRRLRSDAADVLRWQAVLRCILLRLEPVKQLRRAVLDVTSVAHFSFVNAATSAVESNVEHKELDDLVGLASAFKRQRTRTPMPKQLPSGSTSGSAQLQSDENGSAIKRSSSSTSFAPLPAVPQTAQKVLSAASMAAINTPKSLKSKQNTAGLDKDAIFQITSDVSAPLKRIYEAAAQLETLEMHQLKAHHKLAVLKVLCDACYETQRIKQLLERNAEERSVQILNMNKLVKEQKMKQKEVSGAKKDAAFQACRKINIEAAAEAARIAALKKLSSASKKKKSPAAIAAAEAAAKAKAPAKSELRGSGAGKDGLDPSQDQLNAMIEELVLLESLDVDIVEEIPMDAPTEEEEEAEEREANGQGQADEEDDEAEFEYDARGNLVQRAKRQRRVTSQMRVRALDKKRLNAERRQRQQQVQVAESRLLHALETRSERDLKSAVKYAEKNGCRWVSDNNKTCITPILKQVCDHACIFNL